VKKYYLTYFTLKTQRQLMEITGNDRLPFHFAERMQNKTESKNLLG
jgi:hypothetical protein